MYIYTPLCRYWIALYRHVLVFIVPHVDIELEDNKQFISNIPRIWNQSRIRQHKAESIQIGGAANTIIRMWNLDSLPTACQKTELLPYKLSYEDF